MSKKQPESQRPHLQIYKKVIGFLFRNLRESKASIALSLFLLFLTQVSSRLSEAYLIKLVIDTISNKVPSIILANQITVYILIYIGIQISVLIASRIAYLLLTKSFSKMIDQVYSISFKQINSLSYDFFQNNKSGAILAKIKRLVSSMIDLSYRFHFDIYKTMCTLSMTLAGLSFISPKLGLALLAFIIFYTILTTLVTAKYANAFAEPAEKHSELTADLADKITNILTVKTFGKTNQEQIHFDDLSQSYASLLYTKWKTNELINGLQVLLMICIELIVWMILIKGWQNGSIGAGDMAFVQSLVFASFHKLWGFGATLLSINTSVYDAKEMLDIFGMKSSLNLDENPISNFEIKTGEIKLKDVNFYYDKDSNVFQNLNLQIPPGQKIGIVGHSGSGKSTLIKLLLRLMDPIQGQILFDNQNIQKLDLDSFRSQISYVPQQPLLFHRSIQENIAYANPSATKSQIIEVAKKAHAHEFISRLPQGYNSLVGERGVKLSGGERQRIAIARAMLEPTKVLILDEATSALDSISEKFIQESFHDLMQDRTTIVIAHRLSTIQQLDRILVMKDGQIVEDGSHQDLLSKRGEYHKLWAHQNNGFISE